MYIGFPLAPSTATLLIEQETHVALQSCERTFSSPFAVLWESQKGLCTVRLESFWDVLGTPKGL